jgi:FtsH-binding integral membrane protein
MKKILFTCCLAFLASFAALAQNAAPASADMMQSNGKFYVVIGVVLLILLGVFAFLFSLERRVKRLEQDM